MSSIQAKRQLLDSYISEDDGDLSDKEFLALVRDRIHDDLSHVSTPPGDDDERNCAHEWNQTEGEADENGTGIYCLKCGQDGDA